jgi:hypothetical protein
MTLPSKGYRPVYAMLQPVCRTGATAAARSNRAATNTDFLRTSSLLLASNIRVS